MKSISIPLVVLLFLSLPTHAQFNRIESITMENNEENIESAVIDPSGDYAYFGTTDATGGSIIKIDLSSFEIVDSIVLESDEQFLQSAVMGPAGDYAYFGSPNPGNTGKVIKIDLSAFERDGAITLSESGSLEIRTAVIDPLGNYAYFGTEEIDGTADIVKINLTTFEEVEVFTPTGMGLEIYSAVIDADGDYAYFGTGAPNVVIKVDLSTFEEADRITLEAGEEGLGSAVIDDEGNFAYFGTSTLPGKVVKVALATFERVGAITFENGENIIRSGVIDGEVSFAYFGTSTSPGQIVKVDLTTFERVSAITLENGENNLWSAVIDEVGNFAYFGTRTSPGQVVKVQLNSLLCDYSDGIVYVDSTAAGANNGVSWTDAFTDLQDALEAVRNCPDVDSIFVAKGTYLPTPDGINRDSSFVIPDSTVVLGGFPSAGGTLADRDWDTNLTKLSGDIDDNGALSGNSYNVVRTINVDYVTVVDGFTITEGNANGTFPQPTTGGGWFNNGMGSGNQSNPTIRNCILTGNNSSSHGAALYNDGRSGGNASPVIENCVFSENTGGLFGGAVFNNAFNGESSPRFRDTRIIDNTSANSGGGVCNFANNGGISSPVFVNCQISGNQTNVSAGGIYNYVNGGGEGSPVLINTIVSGNSANSQGGGMYNYALGGESAPRVINCVFSGNYAGSGGGAMYNYNDEAIPEISNSIFYNNESSNGATFGNINNGAAVVEYSLFEGNYMSLNGNCINCVDTTGGGNLYSTDPLFVNAPLGSAAPTSTGDFRLEVCSPAINAGDNAANTEPEDADGNSRIFGGTIDMGAYEFQAPGGPAPQPICPADFFVCFGAPAVSLSTDHPGQPAGGAFSGPGVAQDSFYAVDAGPGMHDVTYIYTDGNGCVDSCSFVITVGEETVVTCPANFSIAANAPPVALTGGLPAGGTFSGPGVSGGMFDPAQAAMGMNEIEYAVMDDSSCVFTCTFTATVTAAVNADYEVTTNNNELIITDISGNGDTLTMSENGANVRFFAAGRTYTLDGAPVQNLPVDVALAGADTIRIRGAAGNDVISIESFTAVLPSLDISGGADNDHVRFEGGLSFMPDAHLTADLQADGATPGADRITVTGGTEIQLSGSGNVAFKVSRNIVLNGATSFISTENGDIVMEANQQSTPTPGDFHGIYINGSTIEYTGTGNIFLKGRGGDSGFPSGVWLDGGNIRGGASGLVDIKGTGRIGSSVNFGVIPAVLLQGGEVKTTGADIRIEGTGTETSGGHGNYGVYIATDQVVSAQNSGNVTIIGSGGMASGNSNLGVMILGSGGIVESEDGNIDITGTGGGIGNGVGNHGVHINGVGLVRSIGSGHINIYGEGGKGEGDNNTGVRLFGNAADRVIANAGSITIHGVGGGSGTSDENHGISNLRASKVETTSGSKIEFIGEKGVGENSASILLDNTSQVNALANTSHILFRGDNMRFAGGTVNTPDSVTIKPFTEDGSVNIDLGSTADPLNGPLSLSDAELDRVSAGRLIIGSENADSIIVSTDINRNTATDMELISGSDIIFSGGGIQTGGGTLLLHPGDSPAAVYPRYNGMDVNASTLSFASDIAIEINGLTPGDGMGATYTQLEVTGVVDVTGDSLVFSGSYIPAGGESFVIVSNDGSDAVVGTFNSLPEGSTIPNFLGSGLDAVIYYTGGDGNDVVVTVLNGCPVSGVIYVDSTALGLSDGTSWLNAFTNLQEALEAVRNCPNVDSVLVAEGTYYPTLDDMDRGSSFVLPDSTVLMGGFPSGGGSIEDRDMQCELFATVLSGDIDGDGTLAGNSYHVVRTTNVDTTTVVDGFVIMGGNADGVNPDIVGGGWLNIGSGSGNRSNPKIVNCKFIDNNASSHGGALYNDGRFSGNASPIIRNTRFQQNTAGVFGGAIFNGGLNGVSSPVFENCIVTDNYAGNLGGGIFNFANGGVSSPLILHCKISGNSAQASGGGMYNYVDGGGESSPEIINSIISGNSAGTSGGGLYNYGQNGISSPVIINTVFAGNNGGSQGGAVVNTEIGGESSPVIINSIFYNNEANEGDVFYNFGLNINVSAQYSLFQTDYPGLNGNCNSCVDAPAATNKFEADPLFAYSPSGAAAPTEAGDFRLMRNSPAIDMGLNDPVTVMEDLDDLSRVFNGTVDMGAYEWREYCKQDTVYLDENGEALTSAEQLDLIGDLPSLANCVLDTVVELVQTEFTCEDTTGLYNIYLINPLSSGMSDTLFRCTDTIWVLDTISPTIGLIDTALYAGADCSAEMPDLSGYGMDNCAVDTVIQSPEAGMLINASMTEVELSVIDSSGNQRDTMFVLEVLDTISPTIGLIDTTLYAGADCSAVMPDLSEYGMDNCSVDTVIQSPEAGMLIPAGMTAVELSVIDSSGNSADTMFMIEVLDTISPTIGLIDTTLYVGADCSAEMPDLSGYGLDNCLLDTVIQVPEAGEVLSSGFTEVMLTAVDSSGNTRDTVFMIEVLDTISPTFDPIPPGMDTVYVDASCTGVIVDYASLATDNCGIDSVVQIPDAGTEVMPGLVDIVLEVWDQSGNSTDTSFTIEILDTISPIIAMDEVELMLDNECMASMPDLSSYASDNCGVESFIQDPSAGDNLGLPGEIVTVTLTAIDSSGNESIETFDIEVQETAPVVPLNCRIRISPAVHPDGTITVRVDDLITNASCLANHDVTVYNQWGGVIWQETGMRSSDYVLEGVNLCDYLGEGLEVSVGNELGSCTNTLLLDENGSVEMISAFGTTIDEASDLGIPTARIDTGLLVTYCGYVPAPEDHEPSVIIPCSVVNTRGSSTPYSVKAQPDWIEVVHCNEESDTSEVIYRKWEVFNKEGDISTLTDTIVVLRLPMLTAESFVGYMEDTTFCEIEPLEEEGESVKRYAAWKQPLGIHDYEEAYSKLGGIVYELPATIVAAGLINAFFQGEDVWEEYLECVILKKADGEEITIGDIVGDVGGSPFDTDYWEYLEETTNATQLNYGFLHAIYKLGDLSVSDIVGVTPPLEYFPYLLLEKGDWVLSENGFYEQVTEDWFYNGNANSPYWFAGAWPSIYGSGDCIRYCDVATGEFGSCAVRMLVPELGEGDGEEGCVEICLDELDGNPHCGISIETESQEWTQSGTAGACPATKGQDITVTQTCWGVTANECVWEDFDETTTVVDLEESDFESDKKKVAVLSQWLTLIDTIGPIFDFCYPEGTIFDGPNGGPNVAQNAELLDGCEENECGYFQWYHATEEEYEDNDNVWPEGSIQAAIVAGEQYPSAQGWEQCNPTVYTTGSHDCSADVYVPSVTLKDDCSGVHHVKAMVNGRAVLLERVSEADGFVTFAHTEDPISIPFQGHGNQIEVRYEAADSCWNLSEWYKYIEIKDATPPTVVVDDQVRVSLTNKVAWVNAETFDEGSWDNCGISLRLARRVDWWSDTACVDLCSNEKTYDNWVDLLVDLGFDEVQVEAILDGDVYCGDYDYDIEKLHEFFLEHEEVEAHYYEKLKWLWEDGQECGPMVVHGWLYDIARYVAENCGGTDEHGNPLDLEDLEGFFDRLVGVAGYGKEIAYLGGGWSKAVPFKCEDACEEPMVELLVMDYWCNWGKAWVLVDVEDKSQAEVSKELEDITISCEAYNLFYKDVVEEAAAYNAGGGSAADTSGAYTALDEAFGRYIKTWVNNQGQPTDIDGNVLPDSVLQFYYNTVVCEEKSITEKVADTLHDGKIDWITKVTKESYLDTIREQGYHGVIAVNCSATCEQDVWIDLDDCGYGTITRRFFIQGGCGPHGTSPQEVEQVIYVEPACDVRLSMFDVPEDVGTKTEALCVASEDMVHNLPTSLTGNATLLPHLEGALCNAVAIGHEDKVSQILDASGMYKVERTWEIKDWCDKSSQINYVQEIIVQIDPVCTEPDVVSRGPDPMDDFEVGNREIGDGFKLHQNRPNPFDGYTVISFDLPEDTDARLTIYDVTGKVLKEFEGEYVKGYNEVQVAQHELPVTGVMYYQLDTEKFTATKRMVKVE